jgi:two-component system, OmpR family, response regulator MprA
MMQASAKAAPTRLLLVEDDDEVAAAIRASLGGQGDIELRHAHNVGAAEECLAAHVYDAIILDLTLPDGSGLSVADGIRASGNDVPILMLTAKDTVSERVEGFSRGADDYLCKPFAIEELRARLAAMLRRSSTGDRYTLVYRDLRLDLLTRKVLRRDIDATLSAREMELLAYFMRHPEKVLRRECILEDVWGDEADSDSNVLNVYINYLRNKLERGRYPRLIHTAHGAGYILSDRDPDEYIVRDASK